MEIDKEKIERWKQNFYASIEEIRLRRWDGVPQCIGYQEHYGELAAVLEGWAEWQDGIVHKTWQVVSPPYRSGGGYLFFYGYDTLYRYRPQIDVLPENLGAWYRSQGKESTAEFYEIFQKMLVEKKDET